MRGAARQRRRTAVTEELFGPLFGYLLTLLGILLVIHLLQPQGQGPVGSSRSPVHQVHQDRAECAPARVVQAEASAGAANVEHGMAAAVSA